VTTLAGAVAPAVHAGLGDDGGSIVVLPALVGDETIGAIGLDVPAQRAPGDDELAILEGCAHQCGQALHRARLFEELERRSEQQAMVARLGERALGGDTPDELFAQAAELLATTLPADLVTVTDGEGALLASAGSPGVSGAAHRSVSVPVGPADATHGLLAAHRRADPPFSSTDTDLAQATANVLWNALERHRVHEDAERRAAHDGLTGLPNRALLLRASRRPSPGRRPRPATRRCCSSTWTTSSSSTTRWATRPATRCCAISRRASPAPCAPTTRSRAWAATSSSCCARPSTARAPPSGSPTASWRRSSAPFASPAPTTGCARRSASWSPSRACRPATCCATPTPPCTAPRSAAAAGASSTTTSCAPTPSGGCTPSASCARRCASTRSGSCSSRSCGSTTRRSSPWRRSHAGTIPSAASSRRASSSPSPRRAASSSRWASTCCAPHACSCARCGRPARRPRGCG
jgi:hypothetical protein